MRGVRTAVAGGLVWLLAACGSQPVMLTGRVMDEQGTPVVKAEVFTEPETDVTMTNNRGFFNLQRRFSETGESEPIPPGVYRIKVRKFGFDDLAFEVNIEGGPTKIPDLTLKPRTPDIVETAPEQTLEQEREPDEGSTPIIGN